MGFIADRKKPEYNIVKFNNCSYDMDNFKIISSNDKPLFTLIEVTHDYNPQAKGKKVHEFLKTSLNKPNTNSESSNLDELVTGFLK